MTTWLQTNCIWMCVHGRVAPTIHQLPGPTPTHKACIALPLPMHVVTIFIQHTGFKLVSSQRPSPSQVTWFSLQGSGQWQRPGRKLLITLQVWQSLIGYELALTRLWQGFTPCWKCSLKFLCPLRTGWCQAMSLWRDIHISSSRVNKEYLFKSLWKQ